MNGLFDAIHDSVNEVRKRLTNAQLAVKLAIPSASEIQAAITTKNEAGERAKNDAPAILGFMNAARAQGLLQPGDGQPAPPAAPARAENHGRSV